MLTATGADGRYRRRALRCAATPTRVVGMSALSAPTRVVDTSARYIPLAVLTTPSQCRQPPRGADNARPHSHHRGSTAAVEAPVLRVAHTRTPIYATRRRTQGRDQALVCGAVFPNSIPCVRHGPGQADACCRAGVPSGPSGGWAQRGRGAALWWDRRMRGRTLFGTRSRRFAFQIIYEYLY